MRQVLIDAAGQRQVEVQMWHQLSEGWRDLAPAWNRVELLLKGPRAYYSGASQEEALRIAALEYDERMFNEMVQYVVSMSPATGQLASLDEISAATDTWVAKNPPPDELQRWMDDHKDLGLPRVGVTVGSQAAVAV